MIQLGIFNSLEIKREAPPGLYLIDSDGEEILLPNKFITDTMKIGDEISVFVYTDSEDRLVSTTQKPLIELGGFAYLEVISVTNYGAFLDWGLDKDLFVPFKNQAAEMELGKKYIVHLYEDLDSDRLVASSRYNTFLEDVTTDIKNWDKVNLLVCGVSDLGVNLIVNNKYRGLVYHNQVFKKMFPGDVLEGFVSKLREDGKIDISLEPLGYLNIEPNSQKILDEMKAQGGVLYLHDKSDAEEIKSQLEMSKKVFKKAIGALYRQRLIVLNDDSIALV